MSGAIYGFAQSADRAALFADPHIVQLLCRSGSYRNIAQAWIDVISLISLNLDHIEVVSFNIATYSLNIYPYREFGPFRIGYSCLIKKKH